jgi:hypothetical protein
MEFQQIAHFVFFAQTAKMKSEWKVLSGIKETEELIYKIQQFSTKAVLLEISQNFINYPERKVELEQVYTRYLEETTKAMRFYSDKEETVFSWKINQIKKQLEMPIYLHPGLLPVPESSENAGNLSKEGNNSNNKPGRPKAEAKEAKDFLFKIDEENKEPFLQELKKWFSSIDNKGFVHLLIALEKKEYIIPVNIRKEVFKAFEKLFGNSYGRETNKNNHWRKPDENLVLHYEKELIRIKENVFYNVL